MPRGMTQSRDRKRLSSDGKDTIMSVTERYPIGVKAESGKASGSVTDSYSFACPRSMGSRGLSSCCSVMPAANAFRCQSTNSCLSRSFVFELANSALQEIDPLPDELVRVEFRSVRLRGLASFGSGLLLPLLLFPRQPALGVLEGFLQRRVLGQGLPFPFGLRILLPNDVADRLPGDGGLLPRENRLPDPVPDAELDRKPRCRSLSRCRIRPGRRRQFSGALGARQGLENPLYHLSPHPTHT
jgi:hypothetical protein